MLRNMLDVILTLLINWYLGNVFLFRTAFVAGYCLKKGDKAAQTLYDGITLQRALHSCLENAPQTVLQMYIIISTWGNKSM